MKNKFVSLLALAVLCVGVANAKSYNLTSPDGKLQIQVNNSNVLTWDIKYNGSPVLNPSEISLSINGLKNPLGINAKVSGVTNKKVNNKQQVVVPTKKRVIDDAYNCMLIKFAGGYAIEFRAYDNGAAYRFITSGLPIKGKKEIEVESETVQFNFPMNTTAYWPYDKYRAIDFQNCYEVSFKPNFPVDSVKESVLGVLPVYFTTPDGYKVVVTETEVVDYPNFFLQGSGSPMLTGVFPPVILKSELKPGSDRGIKITETAPYIARTQTSRDFPWRIVMVNKDDNGVFENTLPYQLASSSKFTDTSWIKPGKISWDWWSMLNVYGVDFEAGVNTPTYKYIIDFAADNGFEYILLDEGWSKSTWNIKEYKPEVNVEELVQYAASKGVGVVLWALWNPLDLDIDGVFDVYKKWGVKGVKIDFMDRSEQEMVNFHERVAKSAAEHELLVDFHGTYKPAGIQKRYPNVMTFEGVLGMEHCKDSRDVNPEHNLILPFTRMVAGPMDYTPGAVGNGTQEDYYINFNHPISLGTRAQQAALFVIFESPLQMVADSPSNFKTAPEYAQFLSKIPTVWDDTKSIRAKIGEELVVARRNGDNWYLGALTDWNSKTIDVKLDFLTAPKYKMEIFRDGVNAHRQATDYKIEERIVTPSDSVTIVMAPGGGYAARFTPVE